MIETNTFGNSTTNGLPAFDHLFARGYLGYLTGPRKPVRNDLLMGSRRYATNKQCVPEVHVNFPEEKPQATVVPMV